MPKYRKKPVVVEAFQMTKERRLDNSEWPDWLNQAWQKPLTEPGAVFCSSDGSLAGGKYRHHPIRDYHTTPLFIQTLGGTYRVEWDDFIVQGFQGELSLCKPDIFEATYEPAVVGDETVERADIFDANPQDKRTRCERCGCEITPRPSIPMCNLCRAATGHVPVTPT